MTTWRDVERVHRAHPEWTATDIAIHLDCLPSYVRATGQRRGLDFPKGQRHEHTSISVPTDRLQRVRRPGETPAQCLKRIVHKALIRAWARAA